MLVAEAHPSDVAIKPSLVLGPVGQLLGQGGGIALGVAEDPKGVI